MPGPDVLPDGAQPLPCCLVSHTDTTQFLSTLASPHSWLQAVVRGQSQPSSKLPGSRGRPGVRPPQPEHQAPTSVPHLSWVLSPSETCRMTQRELLAELPSSLAGAFWWEGFVHGIGRHLPMGPELSSLMAGSIQTLQGESPGCSQSPEVTLALSVTLLGGGGHVARILPASLLCPLAAHVREGDSETW